MLGTVVYLYGGWPFLTGAVAELRARQPGMMLLVAHGDHRGVRRQRLTSLGIGGLDLDFWWELALLVVIMLLGHWLEMRALGAGVQRWTRSPPCCPTGRPGRGRWHGSRRSAGELAAGDIVLVRSGAGCPPTASWSMGEAEVDESMITGESRPVSRARATGGAGTVATDSALRVRVDAVGEDTALAGIRRLVGQAQASRSRAQALADRAAASCSTSPPAPP